MSVFTFYRLPDNDNITIFRCELDKDCNMNNIIEAFYVDAILNDDIEEKISIFHIINHEKKSTKNYIMTPSMTEKYKTLVNDVSACDLLIEGDPTHEFQVKMENGILSSRVRKL